MAETIDMQKLKGTMKKKELQEKAKQKIQQASEFVKENKETLAVVLPVAAVTLKGAFRTGQSIARNHTAKYEARDRQCRFYDHKLGCYWYTKRPLRTDEQLSVQRRRAAGENYGDIFKSMKLLK